MTEVDLSSVIQIYCAFTILADLNMITMFGFFFMYWRPQVSCTEFSESCSGDSTGGKKLCTV